jgi:hypothetical protein
MQQKPSSQVVLQNCMHCNLHNIAWGCQHASCGCCVTSRLSNAATYRTLQLAVALSTRTRPLSTHAPVLVNECDNVRSNVLSIIL